MEKPILERVHLEMIRAAPAARRLSLAFSLSRTTMALALESVVRGIPGADPGEARLRYVGLVYGTELAEEVRAALASRRP